MTRGSDAERPALLEFEELAEALRALRMAEFGEGLRFDLADPLAGDAELLADLLQRLRLTAVEPEAQADDLLLALGQLAEHLTDRRGQHGSGGGVGRTVDRV